MRDAIFRILTKVVTRRPGLVLIICALVTIGMIGAAGRLSMKTQIADMMPEDIPQIQEFMGIIDDYQSASPMMIVVESEKKDVKHMKEVAEQIVNSLSSVKRIRPSDSVRVPFMQQVAMWFGKMPKGVPLDTVELVKRIDYKLDNEFIAEHGLMLQKPDKLKTFLEMFGSLKIAELVENINDNFERDYIDDSDELSTLDGEAEAVQSLESMYKFIKSIGTYIDTRDTMTVEEAIRSFITGPEYFISPDNTLLLIMLQPTVDMEDFEDGMYLGYQVHDTIKAYNARLDDINVGGTGWMLLQIDETEASKKDFGWPSLIALGIILLLLVGSFRTWKNPFFSVVTLIVAIIWTSGFLALVYQYLTMMSAAFAIMLVGLGIDFGIHIISGFRDGKEHGLSNADAIGYAYDRAGPGIVTGGMTTAIVFFCLALTGFSAMVEMGVAIGSGIILTMLAALILLPALIMKWDNKKYSVINNGVFYKITALFQFGFLESAGRYILKLPVAIVILVLAVGTMIASYIAGTNIGFEYDMMELEPIGIPTAITQEKIIDKFEIAPDCAMVKASDVEDCREKINELKKVGDRTDIIGDVDGITEFLPTKENQEENRPFIALFKKNVEKMPVPDSLSRTDIEKLEKQLIRLHQNFVEIGELSVMGSGEDNKIIRKCDQIVGKTDEESKILALAGKVKTLQSSPEMMNPFQKIAGKVFKNRLLKMANTDPVTLESLPKDIKERYVSPSSGELLITIYPKSNIWDEKNLRKFHKETEKVSERVTGTPVIMLLFMDLMKEKGRIAIIMGAVAIVLFLLMDFRSFKYTLLAAIPLVVGAFWMVGLMALLGMKFNLINFMCLPLILGIGIDDGVHVLHRYRREGKLSIPLVLKFTGRAILLTSLTTMIGFGSMGLASHRGTASMGQVLFLGVGACFLSSAFVLPAIITVIEKFNGKGRV